MKFLAAAALAWTAFAAPALAQAPAIPPSAPIQVVDPRIRAPASVRQVTNRTAINNTKSGSATRQGWRTWQMSYAPLSAVKVCRWNGYTNGSAGGVSGVETGAGGALTSKITVEYPVGTYTVLKWSGSNSGVIADNAVGCTDLTTLPTIIPAFARFRLAGDDQYLSGGQVVSAVWSNVADRAGGDEYLVNTTQDYTETSTVLGSSLTQAVIPQLVMGLTDRTVYALVGDSIFAGVNDSVLSSNGGRGEVGRAVAQFGPQLNYGVPGDRAQYAAANFTRRLSLIQMGGAKTAFINLGVNDFANSRTAANVLTDRATLRGLLTGINVFDLTVTPQSLSTNGFRDAAAQSISGASTSNVERVSFNTTLRTTAIATSSGVVDAAALVETKPAGSFTGSIATTTLTVTALANASTVINVGDVLTGTNVTAGTYITALGTGAGGTGTYTVSASQTTASTSISYPANDNGLTQNGGVWTPRCMAGGDGTHPNSACNDNVFQPAIAGVLWARR